MKRALHVEQFTARNHRTSRARLSRILLGLAAAGGLLLSAPLLTACDYCDSVELDIDACDGVGCDAIGGSCNLGSVCRLGSGCRLGGKKLFRALDAVAGGVEKIMGFDKCGQGSCGCDSLGCDGGCDSCLSGDMMTPMAPMMEMGTSTNVYPYVAPQPEPIYSAPIYSAPDYSAPPVPHATTAPRMPAPRMAAPRSAAPSTQFRMSEPNIVTPQVAPREAMMPPSRYSELDAMESGLQTDMRTPPRVTNPRSTQPRSTAPRSTAPRSTAPRAATPVDRLPDVVPQPTPVPVPETGGRELQMPERAAPAPKQDGGSLFDTLDDPFGDDVRYTPRQPVQMRPTSYRKTQLSQPIRLQTPQASNQSTHRSSAKAAYQHRRTHTATAPLRTGSSFRTLNNSVSTTRTTARQVSHHHASGENSGVMVRQRTPQLSPAPVPQQRSSAQPHSIVHRVQRTQVPVVRQRPIQPTGQRHSTAGYSGYGHTTNR